MSHEGGGAQRERARPLPPGAKSRAVESLEITLNLNGAPRRQVLGEITKNAKGAGRIESLTLREAMGAKKLGNKGNTVTFSINQISLNPT